MDIIIAIFLAYLAYQNYRLQRDNLRLSMYDKRIKTYLAFQKYFDSLMTHGEVIESELSEFISSVRGDKFLFGGEIESYIDEIWKKSIRMKSLLRLLRLGADSEKRKIMNREVEEIEEWIMEQNKIYDRLFNKYLRITIFNLNYRIKRIFEGIIGLGLFL
jgi:hypothetical protein